MERCFVVQPFDKSIFHKRYKDTYAPAIQAAGLEPYRVDEDYSSDIPIETIDAEIKASAACVVDITMDNPNVWCELGMALAYDIQCCLICSNERTTKYPFDIRHRSIISYDTGSKSDYVELEEKITMRLRSILKTHKLDKKFASGPLPDSSSMSSNEIATICYLLAGQITDPSVPGYSLTRSMEHTGLSEPEIGMALSNLSARKFINVRANSDINGEDYNSYSVTDLGKEWIRNNPESAPKEMLKPAQSHRIVSSVPPPEDDIPF